MEKNEREKVLNVINMFDDVGVYAITSSMIKDYFKDKLGDSIVDEIIAELSAQDMIQWDMTRSYFRPVPCMR